MPSHSGRRPPAQSRKALRSSKSASASTGQIRLIAGQWRGRRLPVVSAPGLRPTGDRVRETLFNWLQPQIAGARCLDLFAGSGALGLEALSRYADSVVFVEPNLAARNALQSAAESLGVAASLKTAGSGKPVSEELSFVIVDGTASDFLAHAKADFDIVFIDPPFELDIQSLILRQLVPDTLAETALIYVESAAHQTLESLPAGCSLHREKRFGDVFARLLCYSA